LFRILCSYLDQGIAIVKFPKTGAGFLDAIRSLEKNSFSSFFRSARVKKLLSKQETGIAELLRIIVGDEDYFEQYLFDQQFSHRGWSGIVCAVEAAPHTLMDDRPVSLRELIIFELLLEIDVLDQRLGINFKALAAGIDKAPLHIPADFNLTETDEVLKLWQKAFEWSYYDEVLAGLQHAAHPQQRGFNRQQHKRVSRPCSVSTSGNVPCAGT